MNSVWSERDLGDSLAWRKEVGFCVHSSIERGVRNAVSRVDGTRRNVTTSKPLQIGQLQAALTVWTAS